VTLKKNMLFCFAALLAVKPLKPSDDITVEPTQAPHRKMAAPFGLLGLRSGASLAATSLDATVPSCNGTAAPISSGGPCLDTNGRQCLLCGFPLPTFPMYQPELIARRTDCGGATDAPSNVLKPLVEYNSPPSANFLPPRTGSGTSWTNGWCQLNLQTDCAQGDAVRDYGYFASTFVVAPDFEYDFFYCKHNGYLADAVVEAASDYDRLYTMAEAFCAAADAEFNVSSITTASFQAHYNPARDPRPTPEQSRYIRAWTCAMGGPGGDMNYCTYTFKDLGNDKHCKYPFAPGYKGTEFEGTKAAEEITCSDQMPARPASPTLRSAV